MQPALTRYRDNTIRLLGDALKRRLVWITDKRLDFLGQESLEPALVAFLGREHYSERRRVYPVQSRVELLRILRLESISQQSVTLVHVGPATTEGRLVTRYELKANTLATSPRALLWLPETLVISRSMVAGTFVEVCRDGLRYFVSADGRSQLAGGSIADGSQFRVAAGLGQNALGSRQDSSAVVEMLATGVRRLAPLEILGFVSRDIQHSFKTLLKPLSLVTLGLVSFYFLLVSTYLLSSLEIRQWQLERTANEVAPLFESERRIDALSSHSAELAQLMNSRVDSWRMWEIIPAIWKNEGFLTGVSLEGDKLLLRVRAPSAVAVLEAISQSPLVTEARFEAGVRQNTGQEDFAITLRLKSPPVSTK